MDRGLASFRQGRALPSDITRFYAESIRRGNQKLEIFQARMISYFERNCILWAPQFPAAEALAGLGFGMGNI